MEALAPKQDRSRETRDRLLAAARALLEEKQWQDISMSEIARMARSSVGSLYARFENKQDLFDELDAVYADEFRALLCEMAEKGKEAASLSECVSLIVDALIRFHRRQRGLIRALVLAARIDQVPAFGKRTAAINKSSVPLLDALLTFSDEIERREKKEAASWSLFMMVVMIRERILFTESVPVAGSPSDKRLCREVRHAALSFLKTAEGAL